MTDKQFLLTDDQRSILQEFLDKLASAEWTSDSIHTVIYDIIGDRKLTPKDVFTFLYRVFIDKDKGPRLGYFLSSMDKNYVVNRIKSLIQNDSPQ